MGAAKPKLAAVPNDGPPPKWLAEELANATHIELAFDYIGDLERQSGEVSPAYRDGSVMVFEPGRCLFLPKPVRHIRMEVATRYKGCKLGRKWQDAGQIADAVLAILEATSRLPDPPYGVATKTRFYRVGSAGLSNEALSAEHCCTFSLGVDPDFESGAPMFERYLARSFAGGDAEALRSRAQEIMGGVLMRLLPRLHCAVLLYGPTRTGKSTFAKVLQALLPPHLVTSTPPTRWGHEYFCASLAGKLLNVVGELSGTNQIPGDVFKSVVGGDMLQGRQPNHQAFEFVCHAAHVFNSNYFPPSEDRSDAFFGKWAILFFGQQLGAGDIEPDFDRLLIEQELPQILAWALEGAARLYRQGRLTASTEHDRLLRKWRVNASSVLEFLNDEATCLLDLDARCRQPELYGGYRRWCETAGRRAIGRNSFFEDLDAQGAMLGVKRKRANDGDWVLGVRLAFVDGLTLT